MPGTYDKLTVSLLLLLAYSACLPRRCASTNSISFIQCAIEQTLSLSGISDVQVLFDYYDNRIRKYRDRLMTDCLKLQQILLEEKSEEDQS